MPNLCRWLTKNLLIIVLTTLLGGLVGAMLVRFSPGYGVDERELDARLNSESMAAIRQAHRQPNLATFYVHYLTRMLHGDLGYSLALERPIRELLAERLPETMKSIAAGLALAWSLGLGLATAVVLCRATALDLLASTLAGFFLCVPSALLALVFFLIQAPARLAIGIIVFPKIFRYSRNLLLHHWNGGYVLGARAKGLSNLGVLMGHVLPACKPQLISLAAVSINLALSAAIPVEVICSLPGIGQLAWQAAMARDLCLLVNLTMIITAITLVVNSTPDLVKSGCK